MTQKNTISHPLVLVVDDDALLRYLAVELFESHGYKVAQAADAAAALRVMETRPDVRLLFTDIQMPGSLDGMDLARQVHQYWPHIRIMIASAKIQPSAREIPPEARFIRKPYGCAQLLFQADALMRQHNFHGIAA